MITNAMTLTVALIASYKGRTSEQLTVDEIHCRAQWLDELMDTHLTPLQIQAAAQDVWDTLFYVDTMD